MGQDKRRQIVGHAYGPSRRSQIMFFVAVAAVAVVIVGGWLTLVSIFDKPPTHFKDTAPWSTTPTSSAAGGAAERDPGRPIVTVWRAGATPIRFRPQSPCAPPSKANGKQGAPSGNPSNVAGVSDAK